MVRKVEKNGRREQPEARWINSITVAMSVPLAEVPV